MAAKKKTSKTSSKFTPPAGLPAHLEAWRTLYPEREAQRTIDGIVAGLGRARKQGSSSVLHGTFENEVGISLKKQPADPYEWLCQAKSLWLTNVTPFDDVVFRDVRPLEIFTQLTRLEVNTSFDTDLSALGALTQLKTLYVHGGERSDWSWLAKLELLEVLKVNASDDGYSNDEPAQKFTVVANTHLKRLEWFGNYSNISHLGCGPQLEKIKLVGQFSDISSLSHVSGLKELDLNGCEVRDISPVFGLTHLEVLDISWNRVRSLSGIENMSKKVRLEAKHNCISDFEPYRRLMVDVPDFIERWIEETAPTQLKLTTPEARAVYDDWLNLEKWKALAEVLEKAGDPMGQEIRQRLGS